MYTGLAQAIVDSIDRLQSKSGQHIVEPEYIVVHKYQMHYYTLFCERIPEQLSRQVQYQENSADTFPASH